MQFSNVTETAFFSAAILSMVLSLAFFYQALKKRLLWVMALAAIAQTAWLFGIATKDWLSSYSLSVLLLTEVLHYAVWLLAINNSTENLCSTRLPLLFKLCIYLCCGAGLGVAIYNQYSGALQAIQSQVIIWQGVIFSVLNLLSLEQLYRNNNHFRFYKLLCLALAIVFIFDAYLFTQHLVFASLDADLWQARAAVTMASSLLLILGIATIAEPTGEHSGESATLNLSRPVIFYTTSLILAGAILIPLPIGAYYVRTYGGSWGTVIYALLCASGLFFIGCVFASSKLRKNISLMINKHLFSYKYDYRSEWLKLINKLAKPIAPADTTTRAISVAAELFNCDGGALWLKRANMMVPVKQMNMPFDVSETFEREQSDFCAALEDEWVFTPSSQNYDPGHNNSRMPAWMKKISNIWLVFPLITDKKLIGFIVLTSTQEQLNISWEDLDLSRTVGQQIASYLTRHEQAELLAESKQFDAFNKLSAFVMHDLKNLIAQQSLVVTNAEKHKDNPAFVEDAIGTIENSVERMNNLLRKLNRTEDEEIKVWDLKDIFIETIKRCQKRRPAPTLSPFDEKIRIKADFDSLVMVFTHLIHNAQDATPANGFVDISTQSENHVTTVTIEDNGTGMSDAFIHTKLFKPFETTKSGQGMGVGVYQAREYIQSIGGTISVESSLGEGTTFILSLPST